MNTALLRFLGIAVTLAIAPPANADTPVAPMPQVSFVTLGTAGGPLPRQRRAQPANAVVIGDAVYLFDVGDGVLTQLSAAGLHLHQVRGIFISHHHIDHNAGLGPLTGLRWVFGITRPLPVIGPPGTVEMVKGSAAMFAPTARASASLGAPAKVGFAETLLPQDIDIQLPEPNVVYQDENVRVLAVANNHFNRPKDSADLMASQSYSYRIETKDRSFVFSGDTGPSDNLVKLARGADVLVTEVVNAASARDLVSKQPGLAPDAVEGVMHHLLEDHLTPLEIGKLAKAADVKEVVITHLAPGTDAEIEPVGYFEDVAVHFQGRVRIARDLERF